MKYIGSGFDVLGNLAQIEYMCAYTYVCVCDRERDSG
jgi:hypothetical protein